MRTARISRRCHVAIAAILAMLALPALGAASEQPPGNGVVAFLDSGDIWTFDPSTGNLRLLFDGGRFGVERLEWSPDGSMLAFTAATREIRPGEFRREPHVVEADGTDVRPVPGDALDVYVGWGCWLGPRLAAVVVSVGSAGGRDADIFLVDVDSDVRRRLTNDGGDKSFLACSPTGDHVAYRTAVGRDRAVYAVTPAGEKIQLIPPGGPVGMIRFSPDGRRLAVGVEPGVFVGPVGGILARVAEPPDLGRIGGPAEWSPDGTRLLYTVVTDAYRFDAERRYSEAIHVLRPDGTNALVATQDDWPIVGSWSPDGRRILFYTRRAPGSSWMMNPDGTCETPRVPGLWQPLPGAPPSLPLLCAELGFSSAVSQPTEVFSPGSVRPLYPGPVVRASDAVIAHEETFRNDGNLAADAVRVRLHGGRALRLITLSAEGASCSVATATCEFGTVPAGATKSLSFTLRWREPGLRQLRLAVTSAAHDTAAWNDSLTFQDNVLPCTTLGTPAGEWIVGTPGDDRICARQGNDTVYAKRGNDYVDGGNLDDVIDGGPGRDELRGGDGADVFFARDKERDVIECGVQVDIVLADSRDLVAANCEDVSRGPFSCTLIGTRRPDRIGGTSGRDLICALSGNDVVNGGGGHDAIDGGVGNDRIIGGAGRDRIVAGAGYDVVRAQDGEPDVVSCGSHGDVVFADGIDRVAADCERVSRR